MPSELELSWLGSRQHYYEPNREHSRESNEGLNTFLIFLSRLIVILGTEVLKLIKY